MTDIVNDSLKKAAGGTSILLLGTVLSNLLWFITKFLIVRTSTAEQLGVYSLGVAIINVLAVVATLGLHEGATKYISSLLGEGKKRDAVGVANFSLRIGMLTGAAACALLFLCSGMLSRYVFYKPDLEIPLKILSGYIPFNVLTLIFIWILRGYGFIRAKVYYMDICIPLFFLILLSGSFALMPSFTGILYSYFLSSVAAFIAVCIYGYIKIKLHPLPTKERANIHAGLMRFSFSVLILNLMLVIFGWTDTLVLGRYASSRDVGIYNIAMLLANLLTFPYLAVCFVFMPIAGGLLAKEQHSELLRTYQILTKWVFSATLPIFFVIFFFPEMIITFLFGARFLGAAMPLRILSLGFLLQTVLGPSIILMIALGLSRDIRRISFLGVFLNITLNYLFIKHLGLGLVGAAVATMLSYSSISGINFVTLYRKSGFHSFTAKYIKPVLGSGTVGVAVYGIAKMLPLSFWMLPFYLIFFMGGYFIMLLLTGSFDSEDITMLKMLLQKIGLSVPWLWRVVCIFDKYSNHHPGREFPR